MKFTKMQGAGNDFIILNGIEENISLSALPSIARRLCSRRISVGADGLMFVTAPASGGDYRMIFFNADGSEGEMCGNGARCICRYGYEKGLAGPVQHVDTGAGPVTGKRLTAREYEIRLNPPTVIDLERKLSLEDGSLETAFSDSQKCSSEENLTCAYIELGTPGLPHAVIEENIFSAPDRKQLEEIGRRLRHSPAFPRGANINFYQIVDSSQIRLITYERGVEGFTLACGTGAGSTALALTLLSRVKGNPLAVEMPGGMLHVRMEKEGKRIKNLFLSGPTTFVAEGEILDEDLLL